MRFRSESRPRRTPRESGPHCQQKPRPAGTAGRRARLRGCQCHAIVSGRVACRGSPRAATPWNPEPARESPERRGEPTIVCVGKAQAGAGTGGVLNRRQGARGPHDGSMIKAIARNAV